MSHGLFLILLPHKDLRVRIKADFPIEFRELIKFYTSFTNFT